MTTESSHESEKAWPMYLTDRENIVQSIVAGLLSDSEYTDFVHRIVLSRIEMHEEEWSLIVQGENVGLYDWTDEATYPMMRYSQYWDVTTEVWKDLVIDVLVMFRGHPKDLQKGVYR